MPYKMAAKTQARMILSDCIASILGQVTPLSCDMFVTQLPGEHTGKRHDGRAEKAKKRFIRILNPKNRLGCERSAVQIYPSRPIVFTAAAFTYLPPRSGGYRQKMHWARL